MPKFVEPLIFSVTNGKGGSGKSTTVAALSTISAKRNYETCAMDLDQQDQIKDLLLGTENTEDIVSSDFLKQNIQSNEIKENLDLITFGQSLYGFEPKVALQVIKPLRAMLKSLPYDIIFIDNPPGLQPASLAGIGVADYALISTQTHHLSVKGISEQLDTIYRIQQQTDSQVQMAGILATMRDRNNHNKRKLAEIQETYGASVFKTVVPARVVAQDWSEYGISEKGSDNSILLNVYYADAFKELMDRVDVLSGKGKK